MRKCYTQQYVIVTRSTGKTWLNLALKLYVPMRDPDYRGPVYRGTTVFTSNKMQQPMWNLHTRCGTIQTHTKASQKPPVGPYPLRERMTAWRHQPLRKLHCFSHQVGLCTFVQVPQYLRQCVFVVGALRTIYRVWCQRHVNKVRMHIRLPFIVNCNDSGSPLRL